MKKCKLYIFVYELIFYNILQDSKGARIFVILIAEIYESEDNYLEIVVLKIKDNGNLYLQLPYKIF